jgi:hypothetical protein
MAAKKTGCFETDKQQIDAFKRGVDMCNPWIEDWNSLR